MTRLETMSGEHWIFTFNLRSGYQQVLMNKESRDKITFITRESTFRFQVMPFGLTGEPAKFQRLLNLVMGGLNLDICLIYLDDIIVFSADEGLHLNRLRAVFSRLRQQVLSWSRRNVNYSNGKSAFWDTLCPALELRMIQKRLKQSSLGWNLRVCMMSAAF